MARKFKVNQAGITQLLNGQQARRVIDHASAAIVAGAKTTVHKRTGRAARSYKVLHAQPGLTGAQGAAYTDDPVGHIIEWGSEDTAPQLPLTRGTRAAGLRIKGDL